MSALIIFANLLSNADTVSILFNFREDVDGLISACNNNCSCSTALYEPVCSEHNVQYFSPCHAGCSGKARDDGVSAERSKIKQLSSCNKTS